MPIFGLLQQQDLKEKLFLQMDLKERGYLNLGCVSPGTQNGSLV
jgi:hypothetical protein